MSIPDNWFFRDGEPGADSGAPAGGPLVILDLDGIISNATHRQHYLRGAFKDFRGFFTAAPDDPPYESGLALAASIADDHTVAILTARPHYMAADTRRWLAANDVRHDLLILRPAHGRGSRGPSADFKRNELNRLRAAGYEITAAVDDDERIIEMYRAEGVFALYVHSGYYERDDAARTI